jgi:hypothetical protein
MFEKQKYMNKITKFYKSGSQLIIEARDNGFIVSQDRYGTQPTNYDGLETTPPVNFICSTVDELMDTVLSLLTYQRELEDEKAALAAKKSVPEMEEQVAKLAKQVDEITALMTEQNVIKMGTRRPVDEDLTLPPVA